MKCQLIILALCIATSNAVPALDANAYVYAGPSLAVDTNGAKTAAATDATNDLVIAFKVITNTEGASFKISSTADDVVFSTTPGDFKLYGKAACTLSGTAMIDLTGWTELTADIAATANITGGQFSSAAFTATATGITHVPGVDAAYAVNACLAVVALKSKIKSCKKVAGLKVELSDNATFTATGAGSAALQFADTNMCQICADVDATAQPTTKTEITNTCYCGQQDGTGAASQTMCTGTSTAKKTCTRTAATWGTKDAADTFACEAVSSGSGTSSVQVACTAIFAMFFARRFL